MVFKRKEIFVFVIGFMITSCCTAQRSEIGFGLGTLNYTGDLVRNYDFRNSKPAATVLYRANLSKVVSFRTALTMGKLGASDKHPTDAFAKQRNASFDIFMMEASAVMEYHFLDWHDDKFLVRFSPYLFGGLALFGISGNDAKPAEYSNIQPSIPLGVGLKYIINPNWYIAVEIGMRKTFFDYLDNVSDESTGIKNYQYGNPFDNDSYYFFGITLTRTFYDIPCPRSPY